MKKARKDNRGRALHKGEYQRSNMKYSYNYIDTFGKRRFIYADTLQELRKKEDELVRNQLDGLKDYSDGKADLNFLFDRYIKTKTGLRDSTLANYNYMYNQFVRDGFGKKKLAEIKYSDVLYFYNSLMHDKGMKVNTLDNIHTTLHPAFQMAVRDGLMKRNPSDGVMAEIKGKNKSPKTTRHALTLEQQRRFMNYLENNPFLDHWYPLLTVLLGTGCRIGELLGLRWEDIDFKNRSISINHNLVYYYHEDGEHERVLAYSVSLPKTEAGVRVIPMLPQVYDALCVLKEESDEKGIISEEIDGMSNFIFISSKGNVYRPGQINEAIHRITKYCNIEETENAARENREPVLVPKFSCHHLRHTFCTRFCENEANVKVIQSVMGHANISTTMDVYTDVMESKKAEAMNRLALSVDIF